MAPIREVRRLRIDTLAERHKITRQLPIIEWTERYPHGGLLRKELLQGRRSFLKVAQRDRDQDGIFVGEVLIDGSCRS